MTNKHTKESLWQLVVLWWLRTVVALAVVWGLIGGEWEVFFISIVALVLTFIPDLIKHQYNVLLPLEFDLIIAGFIFAAVFLGEVGNAYDHFWWWDAALHTIAGVILAMAGLLILYTLRYQGKLSASPFIIALFVFCFGLALGTLWELFEYSMDSLFGTNMLKSGIRDTMGDLLTDVIGSLAVAWTGYVIIKTDERRGIIGASLDKFLEINPQIKRRRVWKRASNAKHEER